MRFRFASFVVLAALVFSDAASAHVTVNPDRAPANEFFRFAVRVPAERPNASTTKVTMQLPEGLFLVSFQPKAGWKRTITMEKLAKPVEIFDQKITERVATVTWEGGRIRPGEFDEFGVSARLPDEPGQELVFPAVQTYSNGEVVRWIGPEESETPAPRVTLTPPEEAEEEQGGAQATAAPAATPEGGDDGDETRTNVALGLGIAGLVAGLLALGVALFRPRPA